MSQEEQQPQQQQQKTIPIEQLHPQQLLQIKKQLEEEVTGLTQSLSQFRIANSKYEETKQIIKSLEKTPNDTPMLIPITSSLYVPGKIQNTQQVLIDYGTGYYVERSLDKSYQFCERKLKLLGESQEKIQNIINEKKRFMDRLNYELQKRVLQLQKQQQQQQQQPQQQKK